MSGAEALSPELLSALRRILTPARLLVDLESLFVYECDALTHFKQRPLAVLLPESTEEVAACLRLLHAARIPFTPRGAGTGLSGGALPPEGGGVLVDTSRMKRLIELSVVDRFAIIEPGLVNLRLSEMIAGSGLFYAPDPSSQMACTIGGNVAENSGGPHCLKYGATTAHVLGLTVVLEDGEIVEIGGPEAAVEGPDLVGAFTGSEGTLGVVTRIVVRLVPKPAAVKTLLGAFRDLPAACRAVSEMIAEGIQASAIEALDRLTIEAVEASVFAAGYPQDAGAVLLVELDGHPDDLAADAAKVERIFRRQEALSFESADDPDKRKKLWQGRKGAFGAMGRVAPDLYVMDTVVPRSRLEEAIRRISEICARHRLKLANVFHAGEGNLHPNISYDGRDEEELSRVLLANDEIVAVCLELGGSLSGEHGIGVEKRAFMGLLFSAADLEAFERFRSAWAPTGLVNPGKVLPTPRACTEVRGRMAQLHAKLMERG